MAFAPSESMLQLLRSRVRSDLLSIKLSLRAVMARLPALENDKLWRDGRGGGTKHQRPHHQRRKTDVHTGRTHGSAWLWGAVRVPVRKHAQATAYSL